MSRCVAVEQFRRIPQGGWHEQQTASHNPILHFCFEHLVSAPRNSVFRFFQNPTRLELLHSGWPKIRLLHHESRVGLGAEIWVEVRLVGFIPLVLGFRHTLFEPSIRFGEEAIHGPFSRFIHIHEFIPQDENTLVRDLLEVSLPWHYGGEAVMRHGVAPTMRRMFHNRADNLIRLVNHGVLRSCSSESVLIAKEN